MDEFNFNNIDFNDPGTLARLSDLLGNQGNFQAPGYGDQAGSQTPDYNNQPVPFSPSGPGWSQDASGNSTLTLAGDPNAPAEFQGLGKYSSPQDFAAKDYAGFAKVNPGLVASTPRPNDTIGYLRSNPNISTAQAKSIFEYEKARAGNGESAASILRRNGGNIDEANKEMSIMGSNYSNTQKMAGEDLDRRMKEAQLLRAMRPEQIPPHLTEVVDPQDPSRMLRVDINSYKGGSIGDAGVVGTSGKEPKQEEQARKMEEIAKKKVLGQEEFSTELETVRGLYDDLNKLKALPSTGRGALSNLVSSSQASGVGQFAGKMLGTEEQRIRDEISSARMRLVQAVKNATGMSAQQMNSNVELKTMLDSLGDTSKTYEANIGILDSLKNRYGGGDKSAPSQQATSVPSSSVDYQETMFNAKKAIARNPAARAAVIQKMQSAGYDTRGL